MKTKLFRILGWLEGSSLIALLFAAMPLKYMLNLPQPVSIVGSIHGFLFLGYLLAALALYVVESWPIKKLFFCLVLSSVPFGTFYFEKKFLRVSK